MSPGGQSVPAAASESSEDLMGGDDPDEEPMLLDLGEDSSERSGEDLLRGAGGAESGAGVLESGAVATNAQPSLIEAAAAPRSLSAQLDASAQARVPAELLGMQVPARMGHVAAHLPLGTCAEMASEGTQRLSEGMEPPSPPSTALLPMQGASPASPQQDSNGATVQVLQALLQQQQQQQQMLQMQYDELARRQLEQQQWQQQQWQQQQWQQQQLQQQQWQQQQAQQLQLQLQEQQQQLEELGSPGAPLGSYAPSPGSRYSGRSPGSRHSLRSPGSQLSSVSSRGGFGATPLSSTPLHVSERRETEEDAAQLSMEATGGGDPVAVAAANAVRRRDSEVARYKQRTQKLLRERATLACDVEELQEALSQAERQRLEAEAQAQASHAESSMSSTSNLRRHSAQLATVAKATQREKQRRLAARTDVAKTHRQVKKKQAQSDELESELKQLHSELLEGEEQRALVEGRIDLVKQLEAQLKLCRQQIGEIETSWDAADGAAAAAGANADGANADGAASGDEGDSAEEGDSADEAELGQREEFRRRELDLQKRAKEARLLSSSFVSKAAEWRQDAERQRWLLEQAQLAAEGLDSHHISVGEDAAEAEAHAKAFEDGARWRAEAHAFAAEVDRLQAAHARIEERRAAEARGWHYFREQVQAQLESRTERLVEAQQRAWKLRTMAPGADHVGVSDLTAALSAARDELSSATEEVERIERSMGNLQEQIDSNRGSLAQLRAVETKLKATL